MLFLIILIFILYFLFLYFFFKYKKDLDDFLLDLYYDIEKLKIDNDNKKF